MDVKINMISIWINTHFFNICNGCQDEYNVKMCNGCQDKHNVKIDLHMQIQNMQWMSR